MTRRVITGHTANNPVARALAKTRLRSVLLTSKLRLYTLDPGVDDSEHLSGLTRCLQVVALACERQWPGLKPSDVSGDHSVLRGGLSALAQVMHRWDPLQAGAIEAAIDRAERLNNSLKTEHVYDAFVDALVAEHAAQQEMVT